MKKLFNWKKSEFGKEFDIEFILTYNIKDQQMFGSKIKATELFSFGFENYLRKLFDYEINNDQLIKISTCIYGMGEKDIETYKNYKFVKELIQTNGKLFIKENFN